MAPTVQEFKAAFHHMLNTKSIKREKETEEDERIIGDISSHLEIKKVN